MVLANFHNGTVLGIISFEDQFFVLSAQWYTESNLIVGCSNGTAYYVCIEPTDVSNKVNQERV